MRYLVNLPLIGAFLCGWMLLYLTVLTSPPRGGDAGMGASMAIVGSGVFMWGLLAIVMVGSALVGAFDWLPAEGRAGRVFLVIVVFAVVVVVSLIPTGVAMETAGRTDSVRWSATVIWASRAVAEGLPLILLAYAAWSINAPEELRDVPGLRYGLIGAVAVLCLVGLAVSFKELGHWSKQADATAAAARQEEDEKLQARRSEFAALTDADTLFKWYEYSTYASPDDMRLEALRRMAARPNLEAELRDVLRSGNYLWANEGVRLVADLPFQPSAGLAEAVAKRLDAYAHELDEKSKLVTYDGDKRLDYYERSNLQKALAASRRVAESAGADLRPQIDALLKSVALYPKSDMAREFPRDAADAKKQVAATLAARASRAVPVPAK